MKLFKSGKVFLLLILAFVTMPQFAFAESCEVGDCKNPPYHEVNKLLTEKALKHNVPPEIVKAIAYIESDWDQFKNGKPHVSSDGGIGIMQITDNEQHFNFDTKKLKYDIEYNIEAGIQVLTYNFEQRSGRDLPKINDMNPDVIEHWYFAVMAYNGTVHANSPLFRSGDNQGKRNMNSYQDKVFSRIASSNPGLNLYRELNEVKLSDLDYRSNHILGFKKNSYEMNRSLQKTRHLFKEDDLVMSSPNLNVRVSPTATARSLGTIGNQNVLTIQDEFAYDENKQQHRNNHFVWYPVQTKGSKLEGYVASSNLEHIGERVRGASRYETATAISKRGWSEGADTVIISTGADYPDALAGAPLAYKLDAPILLTRKDTLHSATASEIKRLGAKKAIILGGTGAVSSDVEKSLKGMGLKVDRIGGSQRYETAQLIAKELGSKEGKAIIAYGRNFPDALAIAPYAAQNGYPILLTDTDKLASATTKALSDNRIKETIVVGGTGAISNNVVSNLPKPTRINGSDRYETAAKIVSELQTAKGQDQVFVATGTNFADALTGSVLAAKEGAPILLAGRNSLHTEVEKVINHNHLSYFNVLGGQTAVSDEIVIQLK